MGSLRLGGVHRLRIGIRIRLVGIRVRLGIGVRLGLASIQPERDPAPGQPEIRAVARQHDDAVMPVREQAPEDARGLIVAEMLGRLVEEEDGGRAQPRREPDIRQVSSLYQHFCNESTTHRRL